MFKNKKKLENRKYINKKEKDGETDPGRPLSCPLSFIPIAPILHPYRV